MDEKLAKDPLTQARKEVNEHAFRKSTDRLKGWIEATDRYAKLVQMSVELGKRTEAIMGLINADKPEAEIQEVMKAYRQYSSDFVALAKKCPSISRRDDDCDCNSEDG
jgi:hypothetical protein